MVTTVMVWLLKYWYEHGFKLSDLNIWKLNCMCIRSGYIVNMGQVNASMDEESMCMLKLIWCDLGV